MADRMVERLGVVSRLQACMGQVDACPQVRLQMQRLPLPGALPEYCREAHIDN